MRGNAGSDNVIQAKLSVSKPADPLEREADRTADKVMRMPGPQVQRAVGPVAGTGPPQLQRFGVGKPAVTADTQSEIQRATTGGRALPSEVRSYMEPRLGADLGDVRVHADEGAHSMSNHLSASAFTYRNHVFFGRGQYQPGTGSGRHLLAHELTHTVQQGATVQRTARPEVQRAAGPGHVPEVTASGSPPAVQRLGVQDALDYFADKAYNIPGFRMLTLVLGFNPINMRSAPRTAANFLRALIELIPGGAVIARVLDNHGVINRAAEWVEQKVAALGDIGAMIVDALRRFIDSLGWSDIFDLGDVWDRAKRIFTGPIGQLISFGAGVVVDLLDLVKQALLRPLAALARRTAGYDLLKVILGEDPITRDPVPRTADTLIGGFMKLIGQEEVWQNIKRGNAVVRAFAWFNGALAGLMGFVRSIPGRLVQTITSLTFPDVITVVGAFRKVGSAFLSLAAEFGAWAFRQVISLLEILFSVVAPGVMPYIAKAKTAFRRIIRNPIGFVRNLVRAGKLGFQRFAGNILKHLKTALITWITGPLGEAGVYIPKSFSLVEIIRLVLSVLGLTWQNIRTKLLRIIPEPVLAALEKTASILVTLVTQGPAAAWEQIKAELTELKDQLIGQVTTMIQTEVVKAAVAKLVSMLNPAGAVIQAIIAVYNTVTFFVGKARQIGAVVASFIDSISAIAAGQVVGAAQRVEKTMANTLTVVLAFLAKFAGLGGIPGKLVGIVRTIRQPIDKALDRIVAWLGAMLEKVVAKAKATARKLLEWWRMKEPVAGGDEPHTLTFDGEKGSATLVIRSAPEKPSTFLAREHGRSGANEDLLKEPLKETQKSEEAISATQGALVKFDDKDPTPTGTRQSEADTLSKKLNSLLKKLSGTISGALTAWGIADQMPTDIVIERPERFTVAQKKAIAQQYLDQRARLAGTRFGRTQNLAKDSTGRKINVAAGIDRRHVVSSDDMAKHYGEVLVKSTRSAAKLLVEQGGSISDAREPVIGKGKKKVTADLVIAAARRRFKRYFGYARNIFLGRAWENQAVFKEKLDTEHPELQQKAKLEAHVAHIKRGWALDKSFKESRLED
ncbi:DUF4157 domain-containing protein [Arthrobacter sp. H20]|uniref:eCIS core domain-containing protein n=1 Tax=Arthrobacter sp. H20 TaxID=1267981 RepID=UPI001C1E85DB|nr:DUF4157 domain-containing protein [Arthrobacter sp. H20]